MYTPDIGIVGFGRGGAYVTRASDLMGGMYYNPAGLYQLDGFNLEGGLLLLRTNRWFERTGGDGGEDGGGSARRPRYYASLGWGSAYALAGHPVLVFFLFVLSQYYVYSRITIILSSCRRSIPQMIGGLRLYNVRQRVDNKRTTLMVRTIS